MYVNMCIHVCVCVSVFMCMHVCLCYVLSFASNSCEPLPPLTLFFLFCALSFSLSLPLICDLSSFRRQSSNSSHSRVEYLVWPQQLTRLHGVHFFCQAPLSLCLHIRPSIVKHVFYCVCVCVYVLYSDLSTYIHRNVCLMPVKWGQKKCKQSNA